MLPRDRQVSVYTSVCMDGSHIHRLASPPHQAMAISTEDSLEQPQKHARFDVRMQAICHDVSNSSSSRAGLDRYVFGSAHNWQLEQTQTSCPVSSVAYVPLRVLAKRRKRQQKARAESPSAGP
ncbi:hypothetical protein NM208_g8290 [Fusarium decemcellulare]|uniref:Uncharacterized protein n=1 Tax=Fusarium decemcellulare TaxID=57161 RepID=A0ACC1S5V0_9HYPO|nr:hypothetical protein NM208_g8290 [Fusarium decemcellulare]